jgi:hypothetical protein
MPPDLLKNMSVSPPPYHLVSDDYGSFSRADELIYIYSPTLSHPSSLPSATLMRLTLLARSLNLVLVLLLSSDGNEVMVPSSRRMLASLLRLLSRSGQRSLTSQNPTST